jgi:outer membrane cobalamin receptor
LGVKDGQWGPRQPNPDLKPEEAKSYDAGFEINHHSLHVGLNYFETVYRNKITGWSPALNLLGKVYLKGFEIKAAVLDGEALNSTEAADVSKWPTREEQISLLLGQIVGVGAKLNSQIIAVGGGLASQIKQLAEKEEAQQEG